MTPVPYGMIISSSKHLQRGFLCYFPEEIDFSFIMYPLITPPLFSWLQVAAPSQVCSKKGQFWFVGTKCLKICCCRLPLRPGVQHQTPVKSQQREALLSVKELLLHQHD